jgi:flagellar biosynthetic protein FlhB
MAQENEDGQEKTEDATSKKLEESRNKGSVPKSQEVNTTVVFMSAIGILYVYGSSVKAQFSFIMKHVFSNIHTINITYEYAITQLPKAVLLTFSIMGPILFVIMIGGLIANYSQVGFLFTTKPLEPKLSKINPISGFKKVMFSKKSLEELIKNFMKLFVVGYVSYSTVMGRVDEFPGLIYLSIEQLFEYMFDVVIELSIKVVLAYIVIAVLDAWFQKWNHMEEQKMTKKEVTDETKSSDGNPEIKGKIKHLQKQMAMNRMMGDVPDADVVVTNPTHFAVALKYDSKTMAAPTIVAKGQDLVAQKIKHLAKEHNITIVENVDLARALFKTANVGDVVPEDLFQAVAEILAFVYRLKGKS